jgi:hypothetical protein
MYLPVQPEPRKRANLSNAASLMLRTTAGAWGLSIKPDGRVSAKPFQTLPSLFIHSPRYAPWPSRLNMD